MIDIHCHVIYGVDDGPGDADSALEMLKTAHRDGISAVIATPHYNSACRTNGQLLAERAGELAGRLRLHGLDLKVYTGNECQLDVNLLGDLSEGRCLTLAGSRFVLTEISSVMPHTMARKLLFELLDNGYIPVIAHCERLVLTKRDAGRIDDLYSMGCLMQLNAETVLEDGKGWFADWIYRIVEDGTVAFISSDAHDPVRRKPLLSAARAKVTRLLDARTADRIFKANAARILESATVAL